MSVPPAVGRPPWTLRSIRDSIDEFTELYARRPIQINEGGMQAPHMFATWYMVRVLDPDLIVESGVWKGQGTWILEQACPAADVVCIDPQPSALQYASRTATYSTVDFNDHDWGFVSDRSLVFFDDHVDAYRRLQQCRWHGFKHAIFDDNYPPGRGDCFSLRKAFAGVGFAPSPARGLRGRFRRFVDGIVGDSTRTVAATPAHSELLRRNLEVYAEFPPLFRTSHTRWGDPWDDRTYPTTEAVLPLPARPEHLELAREAQHYTWICYAQLSANSDRMFQDSAPFHPGSDEGS